MLKYIMFGHACQDLLEFITKMPETSDMLIDIDNFVTLSVVK